MQASEDVLRDGAMPPIISDSPIFNEDTNEILVIMSACRNLRGGNQAMHFRMAAADSWCFLNKCMAELVEVIKERSITPRTVDGRLMTTLTHLTAALQQRT